MDVDPEIERTEQRISSSLQSDVTSRDSTFAGNNALPVASNAHERWSKLPKARGRQPRDPQGQTVKFQCRNTDEMESFLRSYLEAPTVPAEHATLEFVFHVASAFTVYATDIKHSKKPGPRPDKQHLYGKLDVTAISVIDALSSSQDAKAPMRKQKAIAKVCVEACEKVDGYRYSFHNNWFSREDEAYRFSYFCNDSTLNKGRAANEGAGTSGKKMRKPVYNCQGLIAIKFSATKQNLELQYKHVPVHQTYAERAPPPRRDSKRRKMMELFDPESLAVGKRPRKRTIEGEAVSHASQNRTTDAVDSSSRVPDSGRDHGLQPLVRFLDPVGSAVRTENSTNTSTNHLNHGNVVPESTTAAICDDSMEAHGIAQQNGLLISDANTFRLHSGRPQPRSQLSTNSRPRQAVQESSIDTSYILSSVPEPAARSIATGTPDATIIALTEIEALKKKLEEAEERIRKLETEKATASSIQRLTQSFASPQHASWSHSLGYPLPTTSHPPSTAEIHFQPSAQRPSLPIPAVQSTPASTPGQTASPAPHSDTTRPSSTAAATASPTTSRLMKKKRLPGSKFVLYTPTPRSRPRSSAEQARHTVTPAEPAPTLQDSGRTSAIDDESTGSGAV